MEALGLEILKGSFRGNSNKMLTVCNSKIIRSVVVMDWSWAGIEYKGIPRNVWRLWKCSVS